MARRNLKTRAHFAVPARTARSTDVHGYPKLLIPWDSRAKGCYRTEVGINVTVLNCRFVGANAGFRSTNSRRLSCRGYKLLADAPLPTVS